MVKERNFVVGIILSIITCGIYYIYWFITLTDDVRVVNKNSSLSGVKSFLFTIITCGIYGYYWAYKMGKTLVKAKEKNNLPAEDNSVLYLILQLLGFGIINYALMQNDLNQIARGTKA